MATKDIVPRSDNSTDIGTSIRYIDKVYTNRIYFGDGTWMDTAPSATGYLTEMFDSYDDGGGKFELNNIKAGGSDSVAHGLSGVPKFAQMLMRCKSYDLGWGSGEKFFIEPFSQYGSGLLGITIRWTSTTLYVYCKERVQIVNKTSGYGTNITNFDRWQVIVRLFY